MEISKTGKKIMPITSSKILSKTLQSSGLVKVVESHIDHAGFEHRYSYSIPNNVDLGQRLIDRVGEIEENIKSQEIDMALNLIENGYQISLNWCTLGDLKTSLLQQRQKKQEEENNIKNKIEKISNKIIDIGE